MADTKELVKKTAKKTAAKKVAGKVASTVAKRAGVVGAGVELYGAMKARGDKVMAKRKKDVATNPPAKDSGYQRRKAVGSRSK